MDKNGKEYVSLYDALRAHIADLEASLNAVCLWNHDGDVFVASCGDKVRHRLSGHGAGL